MRHLRRHLTMKVHLISMVNMTERVHLINVMNFEYILLQKSYEYFSRHTDHGTALHLTKQ